jgi:hypothetical protein
VACEPVSAVVTQLVGVGLTGGGHVPAVPPPDDEPPLDEELLEAEPPDDELLDEEPPDDELLDEELLDEELLEDESTGATPEAGSTPVVPPHAASKASALPAAEPENRLRQGEATQERFVTLIGVCRRPSKGASMKSERTQPARDRVQGILREFAIMRRALGSSKRVPPQCRI